MSLPSLPDVLCSPATPDSPLANTLSVLFEASPILFARLVPSLVELPLSTSNITTYTHLIGLAISVILAWNMQDQAAFVAAHPRIGQVANLSHLSAQEQAAKATPPEILTRLEQLNAFYEKKYPGLRYITFVNGRTRAEIKNEMESKLGIDGEWGKEDPDKAKEAIVPVKEGGEEWAKELKGALRDIELIAKSRLNVLGAL